MSSTAPPPEAAPSWRDIESEVRFWDAHRRARPRVVVATAVVIVVVFGLEMWWGGSESAPTLYRMGANVPARVAQEPWRLLSSAFLHWGVIHLAVNTWALLAIGRFLERVLGSARFMVLYAVSALGGGLLSAFASSSSISAGASGAIWGLMVGEFVLTLRPSPWLPERIRLHARSVAWQPLLINLFISFAPGIDLWAHFGGGLAGAALVASGVLLPGRIDEERGVPVTGPGWWALAALCAAAMIGSLLYGWSLMRPWDLRSPLGL